MCSSIGDQTRTLFFASNERKSKIESNRAFARFTKLLIKQTRTSNEFELVHLFEIELEHHTSDEQTMTIEPNEPPFLELLNYSSNRLEH